MRTEEAIRKELGIPAGADVTIIDLDATKTIETRLHGWTDDMIRSKSIEELDVMIEQRMKAVDRLQATVDAERVEVNKLREVRAKRVTLGD